MSSRLPAADEAIAVLARTRGRALVGYAFLLTGDLRDAEDLVQDVMVRTFSRRRPIDPGAVEGYARRAILNAYIDGYRAPGQIRTADTRFRSSILDCG